MLRFADLELNQDSYEVRLAGQPVALSRTEFRLLRYLMLNTGRVLTRDQLLRHVWSYDFDGSSTNISYLRRKLGALGPDLIHTERGVRFGLRQPCSS